LLWIDTDMFVMLLLFNISNFTLHFVHVVMNLCWHVCCVIFFFHFILRYISYSSSWIDADMFVMLLFSIIYIFLYILACHELMLTCFVMLLFLINFVSLYIAYMSWVKADMFVLFFFFIISILRYIAYIWLWIISAGMFVMLFFFITSLLLYISYILYWFDEGVWILLLLFIILILLYISPMPWISL
jgi:hypothetical protein